MATPRLASVALRGADGGPLYVDVRSGARPGESRPAVVICHGFKGFKDWGFFPVLGDRLAVAGFTAVSFNFSGSGVGPRSDTVDEPARWTAQQASNDLADLATVVDHVVAEGAPWVALVGHSRGGAMAVLHAAKDPRVRAVVTWAAVSRLLWHSAAERERWRREGHIDVTNTRTGQVLPIALAALDDLEANAAGSLNVLAAAGRVRQPWLLVHGDADESVPAAQADELARASASARLERLSVEGAGHTFGVRHPWHGSDPRFESVLAATVRFLSGALA